jgi:CHASE3 domain sensor protein
MEFNKKKLEIFTLPVIFILIIAGFIFFEIFKDQREEKIRIDFKKLNNQERKYLKDGYEALFQIKLMEKELKNLEKKNKKDQDLKKKIEDLKKRILEEKDVFKIEEISQEVFNSGLWERIYKLESEN